MMISRSEYQRNRRRIRRNVRVFALMNLAKRLGFKLLQEGRKFHLLWWTHGYDRQRSLSNLSYDETLDILGDVIFRRISDGL